MLISIHNKLKGWVSGVIVAGIIVVFAFWGASNYLSDGFSARVVATVDGEDISYTDFTNLYQSMVDRQEQLQKQTGMKLPLNEAEIQQRALDALIQERALMAKTKVEHYAISEQAVQQWLQMAPEFQEDGKFSVERFAQIARQFNFSEQALFNKVRESILVEQLPRGLNKSSFVLDSETVPLYRLAEQKRSIGYMVVSAQKFRHQITPTEAELEAYYQSHQQDYQTTEKVQLEYVRLSPLHSAKQVVVADDDVQAYYDDHQEQYRAPGSWKLAHILVADQAEAEKLQQQLADGADFAKLAQKHSLDVTTAKQGGDMGWVFAGELPESMQQAVTELSLAKPYSTPVKTDYGYHLLKLAEEKPETIRALADVRSEITKTIKHQKANELYQQWLEDLATIAFESSGSLQEAAEQFTVPVEHTDWITRSGAGDGIASNPLVLRAAFSTDVLLDGNNSEVIQLPDGDAAVIRVRKHEKSRPQTLAEASDAITAILVEQQSAAKAKEQGEAIVEQLQAGGKTSAVAKIAGLEWQRDKQLSRNSTDVQPEIVDKAFTMKPEGVAGKRLINGDYAVIKLYEIKPAKVGDQDPQYDKFKLGVRKLLANIDYALYNKAVLDSAKVEQREFN